MSLSKIGKLTNTLKSGTGKDLIMSLAGFGDINTAAKWLARSNANEIYKTKDLKNMLYGAYKNTSTRAEASSVFDAALLSSTVNGKASIGESKISNTFAGLGTFLKSIWPVLAVVGGIAAGTAAWKWADDKFTITKATAKKHSDESAQAYQNAKTELSTKQSQYNTNQDRIHELRATQNRTSDENAELSQLTKENSLLGTQVSVQKKLVDAKAQQQAIDADMNLNKKYTTSQVVANEYSDSVVAKQEDIVEETTRKVNELAELQKKRDAAYQKLDQMSADDEGFTEQQNIANQMDDRVSKKQSEIADAMDEISDDYNRLFDEDTGALINPKTKDTAKSVEDLFSLYGRVTDSAQEETDRINNIFAKAKFDGVEDQLVNAGKSGGTDAVKAKISEIDGLQEALDNAGISADTLASNIMAIARPDEKNLEGIKENLKDIFDISADLNEGDNFVGPSGNLYNFFKDKTDKQIEDFWNYYSDQGLDGSDWNYMDLVSNFNKSQEKAKIEAESKTFSALFKNSAEDTATDLDTITDTFQTDMSNIKSSMDSIKSGTFQNSDITDLIQQFPELATETDNLQQGLQNLAFDKASTAIGKIRDSVKDVTDPKELAAADKYIQSIMDTMDLSGFDMSNAKSAILGNLTKNLADKHMASVTTPNLVNQLMSEYGNDEIAVQAIMKLSLDPSMANADLDTWKSKIEDTKVQIQLDTSAKNLDNLSKELTRLQTDASDQQTRLNNKSAYNMKATASDYNNLIENGDKQIENLNKQIQEYQTSIDTLRKSKGLSPLSDEDNEQIKQYQDQIQASQMSIENMKASQADWRKTAFNLPVTDMQNTVTALTSAISEMQTETGLTSDTMDSLRTQFSDLKDAHVDNVFDRTAKGLKINTERMKDYLEQQNEFMNSDFTRKIQDYQNALKNGQDGYTNQGLEDLKNLQAQYFAQYQEAAKQFSDFQAIQNAKSTANAGAQYDSMVTEIETAKKAFDNGLTNTDDFKTVAKYLSPYGFDDTDNFAENYTKAKRYFTDDQSGIINFLTDLQSKGLATLNTLSDGSQQWTTTFGDAEEAAKQMYMGQEWFNDMFDKAEEYGAFNSFISSAEEGKLQIEDIATKLADAKTKMAELQAQGADQYALDDQQAVIDKYTAQLESSHKALDDYTANSGKKYAEELQTAKKQLDQMSKDIADESDLNVRKQLENNFDALAKKYGIDTKDYAVDEKSYRKKLDSLGINTWENPASAKDMGFEKGTQEAKDYASAVKTLKEAHEENDSAMEQAFNTLSNYNSEQLEGIKLGDGAYNVDGLKDAEDALQHIADQTGLTKEQIVSALQGLGVLKIDTDTTDLTKLNEEATTAQEKLNELTGSTYKFDFDTSDLDTINKQIEDAKEQLALFQTTDSEGNKHIDYSQEGAKEAATVYEASIRQQQNTEYGNSSISQVDTSSIEGTTRDCIVAAQQFMQAKNEMDVQTQLAQEGAENTLDDATQKCQTAYENLQTVAKDNNIDIDTSDIQTAEDELLGLTDQDLSAKFDIDTSQLNAALSEVQQLQSEGKINSQINLDINADTMSIDDIDAKIQELTNEKKSLIIQNDVEGADKVQNLINYLQELRDKNVSVVAATEGVDLVNQLQERISELQDKNVSIDAIVQDAEVSDLVAQIAALPPEVQISIGVDESNVGNAEAIKAQIESDPASVSVNYTKGDQEPAEDKKADVNYTLGSQDPPNDKTAKVTYTLGYQAPPSDKVAHVTYIGGKASGTMTSIAHADGTMHNAPWNYQRLTPAYAKGNVALKHDEKALVNEIQKNGHSESIVRDGVWSLIPGGAHFENLKKGDIIFSAAQTDALLKHGAISGHARTYAKGSLEGSGVVNLTPAHYTTGSSSLTIKKPISTSSSGNSGNSGNSGLQHAIEDNTDAVSDNSDDTSDAADKVSTELENAIKKLKDNAMDWIEVAMDRLDRTTSKYKDYAESDYSHYTKAQKYYNKAIASTDKEIEAAKKGAARYKAQAEKVAADSEVSKYLTPALKKKVQDGTIDVESLSANQKAAVEAYKEYYDKYLDATQTYREKKVQKLDLAKAKVDNVYDSYDVIVGKREAAENYWNAKAENRVAHGKNQKVGSIYYNDLKKQVTYAKSQKNLMSSEEKKVRKRMAEYLKVNNHNVKDKAYQEMRKQLIEFQTSEIEIDTHIQELNQTIQDTRENIKQWSVDRWERAGAKQDAIINYKLVTDKTDRQIQETDYTERIKTANRKILALDNLRKEKAEYYDAHFSSMNNEEAQKYLDELAQIDEQIMSLASDVEEFKNKIMELRWKPFDDLQNDLSNLITEYQNAQKLLGDSDSFYNDDGSFTTNGLTNILLTQESIDTTKDKIANYRVALDKLDEQYKNGCYSADEYKAKQQDLLKSLQQESATLADLKQNLLDMYTTQVSKENDLLQENIDKRKEALDAKEKYYDYDKTLKKKTKDINTLKAQIAALEGTSNAASKARLEKLRAELADAEDDMADTMHQHEVDMKNTGYENFSNEANKALDNTLDAVKKNAAFQEAIIGNMLDTVTADYDSTYNHLHDVMDQYGMKVSQVFDANISKVADFNREAGKAADIVNKINTSYVPGTGNTKADSAVKNDIDRNNGSDNAGNETPGTMGGTTYSLKLNATEIYLTYSHLKYSLKATWSPSKPEHSDIEWSSTDKSVAKVSTSGVVTGVAAPLSKLGLMSRDESLTRKCKIIANGGPGLAKAECTVHIMPDEHYGAIKRYADRVGIDTSKEGNNLREAMEYAYKNGAFRSNQSSTAVEGFQKAYLKDWFNALPNRPNGATDVPSGVSQLAGYFYSKGKQVTRNDMQKLADILEIKTPGVGSYDTWGGKLKNKILKAYKAYGFSKGGVVRNGIPASILDMIGGDALIPRGDSMLIGANPGETVLTKEFTDQLKPTVATLNEFNARMAKPITPILPSSNGDTNVNSECNITINVDSINNEQDIKKLAYQIGDIITERNKRDWKKVR